MFTAIFVLNLIFGGALTGESSFLSPISSFFSKSDVRVLEETWGDVSNPRPLTAEDFLKGLYMEAFMYKTLEVIQVLEVQRSLEEGGGTSRPLSLSRDFILKNKMALYGAAIVKWFFEAEKLILPSGERTDMKHYRILIEAMPINEAGIRILDEKKQAIMPMSDRDLKGVVFLPADYDFLSNALCIEKRIKLPAALWIVILVHEKRHGFDDIITLQNKWSSEEPDTADLINFEIAGASMGLAVWKILKEDFLRAWNKAESRDENVPERIFARAYLAHLEETEKIFNYYANDDGSEMKTMKIIEFFGARINWK